MSKPQRRMEINSDEMQASNQLIGMFPEDTINNIDSALAFIQDYAFRVGHEDLPDEAARIGGDLMMYVIRDALAKQFPNQKEPDKPTVE